MASVSDSVDFVGLYASFPIEKGKRRVSTLRALIDLEDWLQFKWMKSGILRDHLETRPFTPERLDEVIESIETGEMDYLQLLPYREGGDWIQAYKTAVGLSWKSTVIQPLNRPSSPIDIRFGSAGYIKMHYPLSRFLEDIESEFQKKLQEVVKKLFVEEEMHWAFIHKGIHFITPASIGDDDLFRKTRTGFPLTSFDADLGIAVFFKEFVKGAFWANFLNPFHVDKVGGIDHVIREKPCSIIEEIGANRLLIQVGRSPLVRDASRAFEDYQRLRGFLRPILMETGEDMKRIQREVLGSWRPPDIADNSFKEFLAEWKKSGS